MSADRPADYPPILPIGTVLEFLGPTVPETPEQQWHEIEAERALARGTRGGFDPEALSP